MANNEEAMCIRNCAKGAKKFLCRKNGKSARKKCWPPTWTPKKILAPLFQPKKNLPPLTVSQKILVPPQIESPPHP